MVDSTHKPNRVQSAKQVRQYLKSKGVVVSANARRGSYDGLYVLAAGPGVTVVVDLGSRSLNDRAAAEVAAMLLGSGHAKSLPQVTPVGGSDVVLVTVTWLV